MLPIRTYGFPLDQGLIRRPGRLVNDREGRAAMPEADLRPAAVAPEAELEASQAADDAQRPSFVSRTFGRWRQALWDIAAGARLPFVGGSDPDLPEEQADKLRSQMRECLEARGGEVLARAQAANIATAYLTLSRTGKARFFGILAREFGVERAEVDRAIADYQAAEEEPVKLVAERQLRRALVTPGMRLLTKFNALPEGLRFLIVMRADLLGLRGDDPALDALDRDFRHLLATWLDIGFLTRQRLTWESPASLLEKIIEYEAVHEVRSWSDLRHRLDGDRRCYAFFHPSLPREPLIFVQVALVEGLEGRIEPLLDERRSPLDPAEAETAIFYSITSTLDGLRGISFGNFLIKQVVDDLARDQPNLKQFATLSPMPGFLGWLAAQPEEAILGKGARAALAGAPGDGGAAKALAHGGWMADQEMARALQEPLTRAAAHYLIARTETGQPIDPVARFHLGNGARIERLNWAADTSRLRIEQSAGVMVNYLYPRPEIEANHEAFASRRVITVSSQIADLLKAAPEDVRRLTRISRRGSAFGRMIRRG
jgi:malonyl-CoA decarboxylase